MCQKAVWPRPRRNFSRYVWLPIKKKHRKVLTPLLFDVKLKQVE
jgi:hypothetical protein